jgi:hypothetical protein
VKVVTTSAGTISVIPYDDGIAKGVQIQLNEETVVMLDVYKPGPHEREGEARVLVYASPDLDEPTHCITLNR